MRKIGKNKKVMKMSGFNRRLLIGALIVVILTSLMYVSGLIPAMYKSSVMNIPEHAAFDGTTYPIKKVPDWAHLASGKSGQKYSEFKSSDLVDIPSYSPSQLETPTDSLKYGNADDDYIRNEKITYSVPYMGNYKFDGKENAGSHLAVDIKIPEGTPVYAIANGTVIKASTQSDGFGHHIVIQHNDFPSPDDKNVKETIYSSYSHLSSLVISDRDVVKKGQLIGYSGMTGTATTPHLHFQIDNDEAPWHPFWPFTWQEVKDAGLDFFSAVNAGLGKDRAVQTTINPMKYVQKYIGGDAMYVSENVTENTAGEDNGSVEDDSSNDAGSYVEGGNVSQNGGQDGNGDVVNDTSNNVPETNTVSDTGDASVNAKEAPRFDSFKITVEPEYYIGKKAEFTITVKDQYENNFKDGFIGEIVVTSNSGTVSVNNAILTSSKFSPNAEYIGSFAKMDVGKDKLKLIYNDQVYYSDRFEVTDEAFTVSFKDISTSSKYHDSIVYLASKGVVKGYSDGTFKPTRSVTRAEALKLILEGNKTSLSSGRLTFKDVKGDDWYVRYVYTAKKKNIVGGYPDKTFRPNNTVSKAEFLKILFNAMKVDVDSGVAESPYGDVGADDWFAPYFAKAKELGVLDSSATNINPSAAMTRQEVADAIYRVMML